METEDRNWPVLKNFQNSVLALDYPNPRKLFQQDADDSLHF